jgi:hypothetical protein
LTEECSKFDNLPVSSLSVMAAQFLQTDACPPTDPSCAQPTAAVREPIFEGFGVDEFLVIGSAALATLVGLIVVAWLLVRLTGAHRDYLPLQPRPAGGYAPLGASMGTMPPRRPRFVISPSTWVGVGCVFVLAIVVASWIALREDDEVTTGSTTTRGTSTSSTASPAASAATVPPSCNKPGLTASFLPAGFDPQLAAGFGVTGSPSEPLCAFHWRGPNGVISVLPTGDSPLGPPGNVQERIVRNGRTVWVGAATGGGIGVIVEEKEFGGAPDIWFTLLSTTVARNDILLSSFMFIFFCSF